MDLNPRPVVILGMQRSGTSAVSGALARLGLFLGAEDEFFPADANNSAGYFEQRSLTAFNHKCLTFFQMHAGSQWPLPETWRSYPQAWILAEELREILTNKFSGQAVWGFKQPIASLLMPLYRTVFDELGLQPSYVVCVRNPLEIAASEARWEYGAGTRQIAPLGKGAVGAWLHYTLGALEAARGRRLAIVPYEGFLKRPKAFLEAIVLNRGEWIPSAEAWSEATSGIRVALRHQAVDEDLLSDYPRLVKDTLRYCTDAVFDPDRQSALVREFESWQAILAPERLSGTRLGFAWNVAGQIHSVQEPFLPTGDWQTVRLRVDAPASTELNGLFYNKPCRVWIRRCAFMTHGGESPAKFAPGPGSHLSRINGIVRLDGAYEARQLCLLTPATQGPYELQIEFLLESGSQIVNDAANRISGRLQECTARRIEMERRLVQPDGRR